ncbi:DB domain-containing protein [Aphelenchoides bicaudatus]|nr:DB domain-containing protein [Aphelenchoides bicaudatus]
MSRRAQRPPQQFAAPQQHQSGYTTSKHKFDSVLSNSTKQNESRVVLAPIDGEKVYTIDRFQVPKTERVLVEPAKLSKLPKTALAAAKTQLSKGISLVNEVVVAPDQKRTTMQETTSTTTNVPQLTSLVSPQLASTKKSNQSSISTPKPTQKLATTIKSQLTKSADPSLGLRNVRLVSHDTSSGPNYSASAEFRYPAKQWQLPPSLYIARQNQHSNDVDTNSVKTTDYVSNSAAEEPLDGSYEEALELYMKTQGLPTSTRNLKNSRNASTPSVKQQTTTAPLNPVQTFQHVAKSIDDVIEKTFGEKKPRPKMRYIDGDHKKFRATFATHQGEKQAIPLPSSPFPDETDMDLLVENTRRPASVHPSTYPAVQQPSGHTPLLHNPAVYSSSPQSHLYSSGLSQRPVPIQQQPAQTTYRPLDPNYKLDLCCRKQQIGQVCQQMCNFDTFTDRSLISAVLSNQCPGPQLGQAFDCASSKADHTECCTRNNLHLYAGGQCMPFCRTHQPTPPNLISYIACLQVFDTIKNCYREYSYAHPNIYGD